MRLKAATWVIQGIFLVSPTVAGIFLPLSFNRKLTSGGLLILLCALVLSVRGVAYRREHSILLGYMGVNLFFALVTYLSFANGEAMTEVVSKVIVTSFAAMSTAWFLYKGLLWTETPLRRCILYFSAGVCTTSAIILGYAATLGITNAYAFRDDLYRAVYYAQTYYADTDISALSLQEKLFYGSFLTLGGTASIGPLLSLCSSVLLAFYLYGGGRKSDILALVAGGAALAGLFTMASRSALLSFMVSMSLTAAIVFAKVGTPGVMTRRMLMGFYMVVAAAVVLMMGFGSRLWEIAVSSFSRMGVESMSETARLPLWAGALELFALNPLGYGYEYVRLVHLLRNGVFPDGVVLGENHLHNFYMTNLNEFGVVGLALFLAFLATTFKSAVLNVRHYRGTADFAMAVAALAGLISSMVHMMFATMLLRSEAVYGATFWIVVAIVLVMAHKRDRAAVREVAPAPMGAAMAGGR